MTKLSARTSAALGVCVLVILFFWLAPGLRPRVLPPIAVPSSNDNAPQTVSLTPATNPSEPDVDRRAVLPVDQAASTAVRGDIEFWLHITILNLPSDSSGRHTLRILPESGENKAALLFELGSQGDKPFLANVTPFFLETTALTAAPIPLRIELLSAQQIVSWKSAAAGIYQTGAKDGKVAHIAYIELSCDTHTRICGSAYRPDGQVADNALVALVAGPTAPQPYAFVSSTRANTLGEFCLSAEVQGEVIVIVSVDGLAPKTQSVIVDISSDSFLGRLQLNNGYTVSGLVAGAGTSLSERYDIRASLVDRSGIVRDYPGFPTLAWLGNDARRTFSETAADDTNSFVLTGLANAEYLLTAVAVNNTSCKTPSSHQSNTYVSAPADGVTLELTSAKVSFRLHSGTNDLRDCKVAVGQDAPYFPCDIIAQNRVDWLCEPGSKYTYWLYRGLTTELSGTFQAPASGAELIVDLYLDQPPSPPISFVVTSGPDGRPVERVTIAISRLDETSKKVSTETRIIESVDKGGLHTIEGCSPGRYSGTIEPAGVWNNYCAGLVAGRFSVDSLHGKTTNLPMVLSAGTCLQITVLSKIRALETLQCEILDVNQVALDVSFTSIVNNTAYVDMATIRVGQQVYVTPALVRGRYELHLYGQNDIDKRESFVIGEPETLKLECLVN